MKRLFLSDWAEESPRPGAEPGERSWARRSGIGRLICRVTYHTTLSTTVWKWVVTDPEGAHLGGGKTTDHRSAKAMCHDTLAAAGYNIILEDRNGGTLPEQRKWATADVPTEAPPVIPEEPESKPWTVDDLRARWRKEGP